MPSKTTAASRTIVMTGATGGLGKVAAIKLLKDSPDVHLVIVARGDAAATLKELREASTNLHVSGMTADLKSLDSIHAAAAEIKSDLDSKVLPPLTGFMGNAGTEFVRATETTADGIETTFGVNVLANYVFVEELREYFCAPARIVFTTSDTHFGDFSHNMALVPAPKWRDPVALATPGSAENATGAVAGRTAYSTSKLSLIYLTHALAKRLPAGVDVFSFNPGLVPGTGLVRDSGAVSRFAFRRIMPIMTLTPYARTLEVSGADLAATATGPIAGESGSYINGAKVERSSPESYNPGREDGLWNELTRLNNRSDTPVGVGGRN